MDDIQELEIPEFLKKNDVDDIHDEIFELIPDEYDKSEGQHLWNATRPTAQIVSEIRGFDLPNAIGLIWPRFAYGEYLDLHAELRSMKRKEAQYAVGTLTFTGTAGTVIPTGYTCATESKNDIPSRDYITVEECVIGEEGSVTVNAQALMPGADGNTAANMVVINSSGFDDVTGITNDIPFTMGTDEEDDESLLARIQDYDRQQGDSNTGNPSDYKRWAESVPGTGTATVIRSTDISGLVTIILTDGNGEPASTGLCQKVYNFIMSPDDEMLRLAPCGASLKVTPPETMQITISGRVELKYGTVESVTAEFAKRLVAYFKEAINDKEILYQRVCGILGSIEGVYDYSGIYVNGGMANIPLTSGTFPKISIQQITLTTE